MIYKKLFFPIGAGDELRQRIKGALLINKFFGSFMEVLSCQLDPKDVYNVKMTLKGGVLFQKFLKEANAEIEHENEIISKIFQEECEKLDIKVVSSYENELSATLVNKIGLRSEFVGKFAKYCDLVVVAVPPIARITATFEAAIVKSGKPAIIIPRVMNEFKADNILLALGGSIQDSRVISKAIPILKQAKKVVCITSEKLIKENGEDQIELLLNYLKIHNINASFEVVKVIGDPGETLLRESHGFDLIVAGRHKEGGIRDVFLGGTSQKVMLNTKIPIFV